MRHHNFSAGPAVLPLSVIESLQNALPNFRESGLGLMELSHRSATFDAVIVSARTRLRRILSIPDDFEILFLQGGASLQFYMTPLNLLTPTDSADYLMTGTWSTKALKEARRCGDAQPIWEQEGIPNRTPNAGEYTPREGSVYLHYTSNNTIYGTQWAAPPETESPLIADLSSDICSRTIDVSKHAVLYAGAQKNLGPSGVTAVVLSPWAIERSRSAGQSRPGGLPSMLNYGLMVDKGSMFNTPNTFGIFALDQMLKWLEDNGGIDAMSHQNTQKAATLYRELDRTEFWRPHAEISSRSDMNVTWRTPSPELDAKFLTEADEAGLKGLKGHRSVGGLRASIYNACPVESVQALVSFMSNFEAANG